MNMIRKRPTDRTTKSPTTSLILQSVVAVGLHPESHMEDFRLNLLLHMPLGLKLTLSDLRSLFSLSLDVSDSQAVMAAVGSGPARAYLSSNPMWLDAARSIRDRSDQEGIAWSYLGQEDYPMNWLPLEKPPVIFSYRGEPVWKTQPMLSVVGSRTPTSETLHWMQRELLPFLQMSQVGVVSGGARGVDQWSHRIAMDAKCPTICVFPTGLCNPYPDGYEKFWQRIVDTGGCLVSTVSLCEPLRKGFFHIRNNWIAGLGRGCLVVEANRRSGTMLTVQAAIKQNKQICTLPVFPTATQGLANLDLLSEGATMVRDRYDLLTFWNRLRPDFLQTAQRETQENNIH